MARGQSDFKANLLFGARSAPKHTPIPEKRVSELLQLVYNQDYVASIEAVSSASAGTAKAEALEELLKMSVGMLRSSAMQAWLQESDVKPLFKAELGNTLDVQAIKTGLGRIEVYDDRHADIEGENIDKAVLGEILMRSVAKMIEDDPNSVPRKIIGPLTTEEYAFALNEQQHPGHFRTHINSSLEDFYYRGRDRPLVIESQKTLNRDMVVQGIVDHLYAGRSARFPSSKDRAPGFESQMREVIEGVGFIDFKSKNIVYVTRESEHYRMTGATQWLYYHLRDPENPTKSRCNGEVAFGLEDRSRSRVGKWANAGVRKCPVCSNFAHLEPEAQQHTWDPFTSTQSADIRSKLSDFVSQRVSQVDFSDPKQVASFTKKARAHQKMLGLSLIAERIVSTDENLRGGLGLVLEKTEPQQRHQVVLSLLEKWRAQKSYKQYPLEKVYAAAADYLNH